MGLEARSYHDAPAIRVDGEKGAAGLVAPAGRAHNRTAMDAARLTAFRRFGGGTLALNVAVILGGALVRATGSGAGCGSHWPDCNGEVVPLDPSAETLIEYSHRTTSGLALVFVLAQLVWAFRLFPRATFAEHPVRRAAVFSTIFIVIEALVGAMLVKLELVGEDASLWRALVVGLHLVNTFLLLAALTLVPVLCNEMHSRPIGWSDEGGRAVRRVLVPIAIGVLLVSAAGAVTALGDTLFPAASLSEGFAADAAHDAHPLVRLRVVHPLLAVLVYFAVIGLGVMGPRVLEAARPGAVERTRPWSRALTGLATLQVASGALTLVLLAPLALQLTHLLIADLVWISLVALGARALR
jgi:heme A synthase